MKIKYTAKDGAHISDSDAAIIGPCLEQIARGHGGDLTPAHVLAAAQDSDHPLHGYFEWNDTAAATAYRVQQARYLIRSVEVTILRQEDEDPVVVRGFHSVRGDDGPVFVNVRRAFSDDEMRAQIVQQALREAEAWRKRYEQYKELADIINAIDRSLARLPMRIK